MHYLVRAAFGALLTLEMIPAAARAQGWIVPRPCTARILPASDGRQPRPLPALDCRSDVVRTRSDVRVTLVSNVLHYEVDETFVNRGPTVGEADYLFPLPPGAAFENLQLDVNGQLVTGETMDAADARRIYEQIVRVRRDPALVEWMGSGLLRARIFPLEPGTEKHVVVHFQSVAPREGDALRIDYVRGGAVRSNGPRSVIEGGESSFVFEYGPNPELGAPYSPTHSLDVADRGGQRIVTVRGDARDVTLLLPVRRGSSPAITMLPYAPGNEDGFALITITPPHVVAAQSTPRDITFVLDVSGSMQGAKIEQARAAGRQLLGTLRPTDRFRLIDFSSEVHSFADDFLPATPEHVRDALHYLDGLRAEGGTNIEAALREAMRSATAAGRLPLVLFVTDGEPTLGEGRPDRLVAIAAGANASHNERRRIFTFGLGSDVNVSLLEQLALEGGGTSQFVRPDESVERMVGIIADRLVDPVLTDVRIHATNGVTLSKILPAQTADLFADRELVMSARYSGHGQARIVVDGSQRGKPVQWTANVTFPDRDRTDSFVARLWATQRVGYLSAEKRRNGGSAEVDDEIRELGERYGIPTEFTSYLATEPRFAIGRAGSAPTSRVVSFEQAKAASAQRAARSIAAVDSLSAAIAPRANGAAMSTTRTVAGRTFTLMGSSWVDLRYRAGMTTTKVAPFSNAYFDLLTRLPELRAVFALGESVTVVGRDRAIVVATGGADNLTNAALSALVAAW
jgi:Ca-activated chloride channel family protein